MKSDILSAIKVLHEKYEYATKQKWIYDPVSWALYQTWKTFDKTQHIPMEVEDESQGL